MAEGAVQGTQAARTEQRPAPAARHAPGQLAVLRRMVSRPREAPERSVDARSVRGQGGAFPAHSRSPRRQQYNLSAMTARAGGVTPNPVSLRPSRAPVLQRACACGGETAHCSCPSGEKESPRVLPLLRGQPAHGEPLAGHGAVPPIVHDVLESSGTPLDRQSRDFFEPRFGRDLSRVRIHTDDRAVASARAVGAAAYAVGYHIVSGTGELAPYTEAGRLLLAHELTHVLQTPGTSVPARGALEIGEPTSPWERQADEVAASIREDSAAHGHSPSSAHVNPTGGTHTLEPTRMTLQGMRTPVPRLQRSCACGGDCLGWKGEQGSHERPHAKETGNRAIGSDAQQQAVSALGPRSDGLDDAPYFGPASPANDAQFGPGTGTGMGCVIGPMRIVTSGALEGGYTVNDYLTGSLSWGNVQSPGTAGVDRTGVKVQLVAAYSGDKSLGVSQTFTFSGANQAFLDSAAQYLGQNPGSVTNGTTINEPVLNAGDHYAHTGWELQYSAKTGSGTPSLVSFADVPRNQPGSKGSVDFRTCFYSRGGPCQASDACRTWRWTIDFTGSNNVNTVT
jgi:hypothetical protein